MIRAQSVYLDASQTGEIYEQIAAEHARGSTWPAARASGDATAASMPMWSDAHKAWVWCHGERSRAELLRRMRRDAKASPWESERAACGQGAGRSQDGDETERSGPMEVAVAARRSSGRRRAAAAMLPLAAVMCVFRSKFILFTPRLQASRHTTQTAGSTEPTWFARFERTNPAPPAAAAARFARRWWLCGTVRARRRRHEHGLWWQRRELVVGDAVGEACGDEPCDDRGVTFSGDGVLLFRRPSGDSRASVSVPSARAR